VKAGQPARPKTVTGEWRNHEIRFVSLDGVIQAPGGPAEDTSGGFAYGGWISPHSDPVVSMAIRKQMNINHERERAAAAKGHLAMRAATRERMISIMALVLAQL
jgi:hypothetical protein